MSATIIDPHYDEMKSGYTRNKQTNLGGRWGKPLPANLGNRVSLTSVTLPGRRIVLPFKVLEPGDYFIVPHELRSTESVRQSARHAQQQTGGIFQVKVMPEGIWCVRIA